MKTKLKKCLSLLLLTALAVCVLTLGALADDGDTVEIEPNPSVELLYVLTVENGKPADAPASAPAATMDDTPVTGQCACVRTLDLIALPLLLLGTLFGLGGMALMSGKPQN